MANCWKRKHKGHIVEDNSGESVTIVRRQRFEGGFHIRKNTLKNEREYPSQKCGLTPPGGQIQNGRQLNENKSIV